MNITYRTATKDDYKEIETLVGKAWFDDYEFSNRVKKLYRIGYTASYLAESNYKMVAMCDGKVVGFLLGRYKRVGFFKALPFKLKMLAVGFNLLFTRPGRRGLKITRITNKTNINLVKQTKTKLESELCLFVVDEDYRNYHIGSTLHKMYLDFLVENKIRNNYLYTDTYSDYFYYERRGYKRMGELVVDFKIKDEVENPLPIYYIYVKNLEE